MFCNWMYALKVFGLSLELFEQHVMAHFKRLISMCNYSIHFCSLRICGWICCMLSVSLLGHLHMLWSCMWKGMC